MSDINTAFITGHLTADMRTASTKSGKLVGNFSVAVNKAVPDGQGGWDERVSYIDCAMYGRRAETLANMLVKGAFVSVSGEMQQQTWTGKDGRRNSKIVLIVDGLKVMASKKNSADESVYDSDIPF